jgi:hypothetical protein
MSKKSKNDKKSKSRLGSDGQRSGFNGQSKIGKKKSTRPKFSSYKLSW